MKKIDSQEPNASQEGWEGIRSRRRRFRLTMMPAWVKPFLSTEFYSNCPKHPNSPHKECNMFCVDCTNVDAFCCHCRTSLHSGHAVLQIRRSSYQNAVRVMEVEKVLNVKGIQTYVINKHRVLYLNDRQRKPTVYDDTPCRKCETCDRSLMDNYLFCSLKCKFERVTKIGNPSPVGTCKDNGKKGSKREGKGGEKRRSYKKKIKEHEYPPSNSRKRKGVPHRAPLSGHLVGVL